MKTMQIIKSITNCFVLFDGKTYVNAKSLSKTKQDKLIVGDYVNVETVGADYVISSVLPRKNELIRPMVANIDQLLIVLAPVPKPDFLLIDKLLLKCEMLGIKPVIAINKTDISSIEFVNFVRETYNFLDVIEISAKTNFGFGVLYELLAGKLTALAGQSAVGKSSILNVLCPNALAETNGLSRKTDRGKHTTRHSEIFVLNENSRIIDTPGFSMFNIADLEENQIAYFMPDLVDFAKECKFQPCEHISQKENICAVKKALQEGKISKQRYENYVKIFNCQKPEWKRRNSYD